MPSTILKNKNKKRKKERKKESLDKPNYLLLVIRLKVANFQLLDARNQWAPNDGGIFFFYTTKKNQLHAADRVQAIQLAKFIVGRVQNKKRRRRNNKEINIRFVFLERRKKKEKRKF